MQLSSKKGQAFFLKKGQALKKDRHFFVDQRLFLGYDSARWDD